MSGGVNELSAAIDQLAAGASSLDSSIPAVTSENAQNISTAAVQNAENISAQAAALEGQLNAIWQSAAAAASEPAALNDSGAAQDYLYSVQSVLGSISTEDPDVLAALTEAQSLVGNAIYAMGSSDGGGTSNYAAEQAAEQAAAAIGTAQSLSANADALANDAAGISAQADAAAQQQADLMEIGRASCRERVLVTV